MEKLKQPQPTQEEFPEKDEVNEAKIVKDFVETPSGKMELLASHLTRPDGFVKALLMGNILSSRELKERIDRDFVRTHRGFYQHNPKDRLAQIDIGQNDDISFTVGVPQKTYAKSSSSRVRHHRSVAELGFVIPAKKLLERTDVKPSWGNFDIEKCLKKISDTPLDEPQFDKYRQLAGASRMAESDRVKYEWRTPKEDFLPLTHLARKSGNLDGEDRAEININPDESGLPNLSITETIILIPLGLRNILKRLVSIKVKTLTPYIQKIKDEYGLDIDNMSFDDIEKKYGKQIYWYPQKNISLAIQYLTTHPEKIRELYDGSKS